MSRKRRPKRESGKRAANTSRAPLVVDLGRRHAIVLLVLLGLGFLASTYLTYVHYRLHADPGWRSGCDIDPAVSCDAVILSGYGAIRAMPISLLGAWFYVVGAAVVGLSLRGSRRHFPRSPAALLVIGGFFATVTSIALAAISIFSIGTLCPFCVAVYLVNVALTVVAWHAVRASGEGIVAALRAERVFWRAKRWLAVGASSLALVILAGGVLAYSRSAGGSIVCDAVAKAAGSGRTVELVAYGDFQCPGCRDVARSLRPILRGQNGGIRFVLRYYPLDPTCNPHAKVMRHLGACRQALAAICAEAQGRGMEFSDTLFDHGVVDDLVDLAASLGLDRSAFEACLASEDAGQTLRASIESAAKRDVHSTPTLFLNGSRHRGRLDDSDLRCLAKAATWPPASPEGDSRKRP